MLSREPLILMRLKGPTLPMLSREPLILMRHKGPTLPMLSREPLILMRLKGPTLPMLSREPLILMRLKGPTLPMLSREPTVPSPSHVQPTHKANETLNCHKQTAIFTEGEGVCGAREQKSGLRPIPA